MEFDFSHTDEAAGFPVVELSTVYVVYADASYDVRKTPEDPKRLFAVRTTAGEGILEMTCGVFALTPQTLLIAPYDEIRRYRPANGRWDFWWFEFSYASGTPLIEGGKLFNLPSSEEETRRYEECLTLLRHDRSRARASAEFLSCLYEWKDRIDRFPRGRLLTLFDDAVRLMHENPAVTVASLARSLHVSERTLRSIFGEVAGRSPKAYCEALRLEKSARLLRSTSLRVFEISDRMGYANPYHFSRAFRARYQVSPRGYRNLR